MRGGRASWRGAGHRERIADRPRLSAGTDRGFGLTVAALLVVLDTIVYWRVGQPGWWLLAAAGAIAACALAAPSVLSPLNRAWVALRQTVSQGALLIFLAVGYWVVIVPVGLLMGLVGRDRLALGFDKKASTYWQPPSHEDVDLKIKS